MNKIFHGLFVLAVPLLVGCATMMASAGGGLAENLSVAILNQDDPELVRDGAPAYLLMLDSFVEGSPENVSVLRAASELYAAYGVVFVDEPVRARKLTARGWGYGQRALCAAREAACGIWDLSYPDFVARLKVLKRQDVEALFTFGVSWIAWIQAHSSEWSALARLPQAEATLLRLQELALSYERAKVEHFLAVLNTIRPPALGGDFETGLVHFERALALSGGRDLSIKVDFARYYARTLYDRELHDHLLREVLAADPVQEGYTLFNTLAQKDAEELLQSADDYF